MSFYIFLHYILICLEGYKLILYSFELFSNVGNLTVYFNMMKINFLLTAIYIGNLATRLSESNFLLPHKTSYFKT